MEGTSASVGRLASTLWLAYAVATVAGSLVILAIYVNAYDNTGETARLSATGDFARSVMQVLSFPLGFPVGAAANSFLVRSFGCEAQRDPCGTFIFWWTQFAAVVLQVILLRWIVRRLWAA